MYIFKFMEDGEVDQEIVSSPGEIENLFFDKWAEEGFTLHATGLDDGTEDEIELDASKHFTKEELADIEAYLNTENCTREGIVRVYFGRDA